MGQKYTDNALTKLVSSINAIAGQLTVTATKGAGFPQIVGKGTPGAALDFFVITLEDAAGNREKIKVEERPIGDVLGTVGYPLVRGYDGTTPRSWTAGDSVDLRIEKKTLQEWVDKAVTAGVGHGFGNKDSTTSGLNYGFYGGQMLVDGVNTVVADGTILLTGALTNYVELSPAGVVSANTTGFSADKLPLAQVVCGASQITSIVDKRSILNTPRFGVLSKSVAGGAGTTVLTQAEAAVEAIEFTGVLTGNRVIEMPNVKRRWHISNKTTGSFTLQVKTNAGTGPFIPQTGKDIVYGDGTDMVSMGFLEKSGGVYGGTMAGTINEAHGADIASAATVDLNAATGNLVDITGNTNITAITLADGAERVCRFTGSLKISNGGSLILIDGADWQTNTGDFFVFRGYAAGVVRMVGYARAKDKSVDVASAATVNLDLATGELVDITGNTGITAITLAEGRTRVCRFTGTGLTISNGASLVLPSGIDIVTRPDDIGVFRGYSGGVVRCTGFMRAAAKSGNPPLSCIVWGGLNMPNAVRYMVGLGGTLLTTEAIGGATPSCYIVKRKFVAKGMQCYSNAALTGGTLTFTLRRAAGAVANFADTTITATMNTGGGAPTKVSDTTHSETFYPGDLIEMKASGSSLTPTTLDLSVSLAIWDPDDPTRGIEGMFCFATGETTGGTYVGGAEIGPYLVATNAQNKSHIAVPELIADMRDAFQSGNITAVQMPVVYIDDATLTAGLNGEVHVTDQSYFNIALTGAGTTAIPLPQWIPFRSPNDNALSPAFGPFLKPWSSHGTGTGHAQSTIRYAGGWSVPSSNAENEQTWVAPWPNWKCDLLTFATEGTITNPNTVTATSRKNQVDQTQAVTLSNGNNKGSSTNSFTGSAGDEMAIKVDAGAVGTHWYNMVQRFVKP